MAKKDLSPRERRATWLRGLHDDGSRLFATRCDECESEIVDTVSPTGAMRGYCNRCCAVTTTRTVADVLDCRRPGGGAVTLGRRTIAVCGCKPLHMC